jgi:Flp pilus assembly protein TadD
VPVLVEALSAVMRREAIARRYEGAWPGFVADAVNRTLCADSDIARLGFMRPHDVRAFIDRMERQGFVFVDAAGTAVDIVVVDQREGPTAPCAWIEFYRQEVPGGMVSAARLAGSRDKELFCPDGWDFEHSLSKRFEFHPKSIVGENLEFLRRELDNDVFRNRLTGKEVFNTRPSTLRAETDEPDSADKGSDEECAALWSEAGELLAPYFRTDGIPATDPKIASVIRAREALERLTAFRNINWRTWWLLVFARRLLLDREGAYAAFARAYGMAPNEIEVGRNLGAECIALGYGQEAIAVTAAMSRLAPDDAGITANHALALLIGGDIDGALREMQRATQLDPEGAITRSLERLIQDVRAGTVRCPSKIETW